jgi:dihydroneopterin aldolase
MKLVHPVPIADGRAGLRHVFVRDLVVPCSIGVHRHERAAEQRVRINLDLAVREGERPLHDSIEDVVCYEKIIAGVSTIIARGHVNLVETLAEDIAAMCLEDPRVRSARVRVEKLDILPNADSVGVEIERFSDEV